MAKDLHRVEKIWKTIGAAKKSDDYIAVENAAMDFSKYLSTERISNLTQGLVPVSFIRGWFYRVQGLEVPDMPRGQVKVPHLWGYGPKRLVGQFCDGYGDGREVGWAVAVELAAGQKTSVVRDYYQKVVAAEKLLEELLPPKYPFEIDNLKANQGRALFNNTCAKCHGHYDSDSEGWPIYRAPKYFPWRKIRTDRDRIAGNTAEFNAMVDTGELKDIIARTDKGSGYFAPRLEGVWARYPYLHNGSVPNIEQLLRPSEERVAYFDLSQAGEEHRFDKSGLGLKVDESQRGLRRLKRKGRRGDRQIYDTGRIGHKNVGHDFFTYLSPQEKSQIIEYLKTI